MKKFKILAFYKFTQFDAVSKLQSDLQNYCQENQVLGSVLISGEGLNGTIAGCEKNIDLVSRIFTLNNELMAKNTKIAKTLRDNEKLSIQKEGFHKKYNEYKI